ncbi:MAG: glycosyltransferase family 4 protein [Prevotella sp.]|nr:glycosyltransferase family 4 protein [Prevotella sp.]MBR1556868.1 glycosyltransferase family 4 protein [Prevotella sp.]
MKILIVNTSERTGGAAVAANRLMKALNNNGEKAKMLVCEKQTDTLTVTELPKSPLKRWNFLWERLVVFCHLRFNRQHLFEIDIANAGTDITKLREFKEADIIHLHWINQGMLSLSNISKILRSGKPVVWTMHDIWPATGICHVTLNCRRFTNGCSNCRLLPGNGSSHDLAYKIWHKKQTMVMDQNIYYVACSRWLESEAKKSALLNGQKITNVPNCIDTHIYKKNNKQEARQLLGLPADKKLILFASQRVTNENKGMNYLIEACKQLAATDENPGLVILGGHAEEVVEQLPLEAYPLGYVNDELRIVDVYNAVDVFVLPSLSENLPNTIMEAMACGVPCVGFKVGGIPEEIDHKKNGYVAEYRNADDLARGISWILSEADYASLSENAIHKVAQNYSQQSVAMKYLDVYHQAMAFKHYHL